MAGASLEAITSLLDKSLLKRVGEKRYELYELVRQYSVEHLLSDAQDYAETRDRHSQYFVALLEQWKGQIRSPRQMEILAEMDVELANIRLAWSWMVARQQTANIRRSLHSLWHFHEIRARFWEGAALFGEGVSVFQSTNEKGAEQLAEHLVVLRQMQAQQGYFLAHLGRYEEAGELFQQSLTVFRSNTNQKEFAETLAYLAYMKYRLGALLEAGQYAQESLVLNRALGNQIGIVFCLITLSYIYLAQGAFEQAHALSSESLGICRDILGDPHGTADCLSVLGTAARRLGRYAEAKEWQRRA